MLRVLCLLIVLGAHGCARQPISRQEVERSSGRSARLVLLIEFGEDRRRSELIEDVSGLGKARMER